MPLTEAQYADILLAERRLRHYVRQAWPVVEPATPFVDNWHLGAICEHLEAVVQREIRNLVICISPGSMKSLLVAVFFPTWAWLDPFYGRDKERPAQPVRGPNLRFVYSSYVQTLSTRDSLRSRRIIDSQWYQERWGTHFKLTSDQNEKLRYENDKTGYRIATSVAGGTGERGDGVIVDDPHRIEPEESDATREGVIEWWDKVMSTRLTHEKTGFKIIVQQRVHERDLAGHVLKDMGWERLIVPMEYEPTTYVTGIGWKDPRTRDGELMFPTRFDEAAAARAKARGTYSWASLFQQRPAPAEGGRVKRVWFRYWHRKGQTVEPVAVRTPDGLVMVPSIELPETFDDLIQSWDLTFKDLKASKGADIDYVVGQVWAKKGADKFAVDMVRDRLDFPATLTAFRALTAKWPATRAKLVEDKANGPAVIASLKHEIAGIIPMDTDELGGGKGARLAAVSPQIEAGNVYLPHPAICSWTERIVYECITFPNADHDDAMDSLTAALIRLGGNGPIQVYAFDSAGKLITSEERTMTASERFLRGMSPTDPIPEPSEDKPKDPRDGMTPEQRYELGLD